MNTTEVNECMQAVLDGTATPEQGRDLERILAADAQARAQFESWRTVFRALHGVPLAYPPEGLVAKVDAGLDAALARGRATPLTSNQRFSSAPVIGHGRSNRSGMSHRINTTFRWLRRPDTPEESYRMNANRKYWAGGAVALVALGVAAVIFDYPPKAEDVLGTVVPAERYRAPQSGAEAIKLGGEGGTAQAIAQPGQMGAVAGSAEAERAKAADRSSLNSTEAERAKAADRSGLNSTEAERAKAADRSGLNSTEAERVKAAERASLNRSEADRISLNKAEMGAVSAQKLSGP